MKLLVTGGCGFIGSNFINLRHDVYGDTIVNVDKLTYAADESNVSCSGSNRYELVVADICDHDKMLKIMQVHEFDAIIHFAAESHVDRSINSSSEFIKTNINGTHSLLEAFRRSDSWMDSNCKFIHVSTDEVYGDLEEDSEPFTERHPVLPSSPYSASKASSDMLCLSYYRTYQLPVIVTRCCNNYGPGQHEEKLIPLMIRRAMAGEDLPVYGSGNQIREWIYVKDHCEAIGAAMVRGAVGQIYNIGGTEELRNIEVVSSILRKLNKSTDLIKHVQDRLGHDWRYAINQEKTNTHLNWSPIVDFDTGLSLTIDHYKSKLPF